MSRHADCCDPGTMPRERPLVALLESRMSRELARLVEKHGGEPLCVPTVRECPEITPDMAVRLTRMLDAGGYDTVVFPTGVAASLLFEAADQGGARADLVAALRRITTVCRGPKPSAALRGFGVPPTLCARESFTSAELIDALSTVDLAGRNVLLFCCGERSETLAETLIARGARLDEIWLYRWQLPEDLSPIEGLLEKILAGTVDALAVTCQIQFRHLLRVSERVGVTREVVSALNDHVVVGAVGPTSRAILNAHGVKVRVEPDHPKMGPLVVSLMRHFDHPGERPTPRPPERLSA